VTTYPAGQEARARAFYLDRLGLTEIPRLTEGTGRPGLWFAAGEGQIHLSVDPFGNKIKLDQF